MNPAQALQRHQRALRDCRLCPRVAGTPVTGDAVVSPMLLVGQAPGPREADLGRPFAWTAGRTLFGWFEQLGLDEARFRARVYMAAVCRCFPGRNPRGGDRVPSEAEIAACEPWLQREIELLRPTLIVPVGKLAISRFIPVKRLDEVVGGRFRHPDSGADLIPLPHPSGASTWHRREPGIGLLGQALRRIGRHPAWQALRESAPERPA